MEDVSLFGSNAHDECVCVCVYDMGTTFIGVSGRAREIDCGFKQEKIALVSGEKVVFWKVQMRNRPGKLSCASLVALKETVRYLVARRPIRSPETAPLAALGHGVS